jgi:hypothetical protein
MKSAIRTQEERVIDFKNTSQTRKKGGSKAALFVSLTL